MFVDQNEACAARTSGYLNPEPCAFEETSRPNMNGYKEGVSRAHKVRNRVFVLAGTPGLDLTWSPFKGVMMNKPVRAAQRRRV